VKWTDQTFLQVQKVLPPQFPKVYFWGSVTAEVIHFWLHHYECVAPNVDISLQSGWFREVDCFVQGEVKWFQVLLDSLYPHGMRASWWSPPVLPVLAPIKLAGRQKPSVMHGTFKVEMGKNLRRLGSVLFRFCDYQGSVRFEFLWSL